MKADVHLIVYSVAGNDPKQIFDLELNLREISLHCRQTEGCAAMDPTENEQGAERKNPLLIGQIAGFGAGLVVALLFGTNSGRTAISGWVLGMAAAFLFQTRYSLWTRVGVSLISILSVTFVWWWR